MPVGALCAVANGVREALAALAQRPLELRLLDASLPSPEGWTAVALHARIYALVGATLRAALIVRENDARALVELAFGGAEASQAALSRIEATTLDRMVAHCAPYLAPLVGGATLRVVPERDLRGFTAYAELLLGAPSEARIGIAVGDVPPSPVVPGVGLDELADVPIEMRVAAELGSLPAAVVAGLEPGTVLPLPIGTSAVLRAAGRPLARGECGVSGARYAFALQHWLA